MKPSLNHLSFPSIAAVLTVILFGGCVGKQHLDITYYNLDAPAVGKTLPAPKFGSLFVRNFYMNPSYEDKNFNYQTGDLTCETDFYNQFKLSPRTQFTTLTRGILRESGLFKDVIMPESSQISDYALETDVPKFYADFRDPQNPRANLTINFSLSYNPKKSLEHPILFTKAYSESIPIAKKSAGEVARSWNIAYANIMQKLLRDLAEVTPPPPPAPPAPPAKEKGENTDNSEDNDK
jgi:ABC-type uncharacterized transport system auxiliary subunit